MKINEIVTIEDENGIDMVGDFIDGLEGNSFVDAKLKVHIAFLDSLFDRLKYSNLDILCKTPQELSVIVDGQTWTKRYMLVKPLRVIPIYELRYAIDGNNHVRFLFFPFEYRGITYFIFTKVFIKSHVPPIDETNMMRDLTYKLFMKVKKVPQKYLEGDE